MAELSNFHNAGFGWVCRQCESELQPPPDTGQTHSRVFREGEAESKTPKLANVALAKWTDASRRFLFCPRCGISESVEKS